MRRYGSLIKIKPSDLSFVFRKKEELWQQKNKNCCYDKTENAKLSRSQTLWKEKIWKL